MAIKTDQKTGLPTTIPAANASGTATGTEPSGIAPPSGIETKTGFMAPVETVSAGAVQPRPSSMIGNNVSTDPLLTGSAPRKPEAIKAPEPVAGIPAAPAVPPTQYPETWYGNIAAMRGQAVEKVPGAAPAAQPAPSQPVQTQNADVESIIKSIDPTGSMTDEEKNQIRASFSSSDPASALKYAKMTAEQKAQAARDTLQASRLQRDVTQRLKYDQAQYDLQTAQQKQQFDAAISAQKDRMAADQNNLGVALGTSGRLQSQRAMAAAQSVLDRNRQVYQDMLSTRDNVLAQMANQLQFSQKQLSDQYNDSVSKTMQDALAKINALDKTGAMNSAAGLIQARDYVDAVNSEYLQHTGNYVNQLTALNTMYSEQAKAHKEANAFSKDITESMNDGYLYTSGGIRMTDASGGYLKKPEGVYGTPITKEPQKTDDGRYFMAYQQPDGTVKTVMLSGTEAATPADEIIQSYGRMIADKTISSEMLKGMSQATRDKVMQAAAAYAETKPEEVKASDFLKLEDADGNSYYFNPKTRQSVTPEQFAAYAGRPEGMKAGGALDFTGMADQHPGEASFKNNNPAGITWHAASQGLKDAWEAAGINFEMGTSRPSNEGGNYVKFATVVDGINAREIAMERKEGTVTDALKQWVGTKNPATNAAYASSIVKAAGIDGNKTYAQLTDAEKESLSIAQLRREAGGMYQEMVNRGYITSEGFDLAKMEADSGKASGDAPEVAESRYTSVAKDIIDGTVNPSNLKALGYSKSEIDKIEAERVKLSAQDMETDEWYYDPSLSSYYLKGAAVSDSTLKKMGKTPEQFMDEAHSYIKDYAEKRYAPLGFSLEDPEIYSTIVASPQGASLEKEMPAKISAVNSMNKKFGTLIDLVRENWTELFSPFWSESTEMSQIYGEILMEAKEALNLGVLQKVDEDTMRKQIPDPTSFGESMTTFNRDWLIKRLETARDSLNLKAEQDLRSVWLVKNDW